MAACESLLRRGSIAQGWCGRGQQCPDIGDCPAHAPVDYPRPSGGGRDRDATWWEPLLGIVLCGGVRGIFVVLGLRSA